MALSNDLSKLAARSKDAETHTAEAADKARTRPRARGFRRAGVR